MLFDVQRTFLVLVGLAVAACGDDGGGASGGGGAGAGSLDDDGVPEGGTANGGAANGGSANGGAGGGNGGNGGGSGDTEIRVHYDTGVGNAITLRGDAAGLSWETGQPCEWAEGNVWTCVVPTGEGELHFKPLVNDVDWAKGTDYRVALGGTVDIYPFFYAPEGSFEVHAGFTSQYVADRDLVVYLPPSYDENLDKTYPVVLMHDGQNLFDPDLAFGGVAWEVDEAMDALAENAGIQEAIIVGVDNNAARIDEYTPTEDPDYGGGGADLYLQFLYEEVAPFIHTTYRTEGDRVGIAGSSLGGLVSLYGCWAYPQEFDRCGVFSPSLWWDNRELLEGIDGDGTTAADKPLVIYLDSGDSGTSNDGMQDTAEMRDILLGKGFVMGQNLDYVLGQGQSHNESAWAARTPGALAFLLADPNRVQ